MKLKDNLFIFLTGVLLVLFAIKTGKDIWLCLIERPVIEEYAGPSEDFAKRMRELEAIGIVPKEAKYYEVIDE